jgi:hypothetical protein
LIVFKLKKASKQQKSIKKYICRFDGLKIPFLCTQINSYTKMNNQFYWMCLGITLFATSCDRAKSGNSNIIKLTEKYDKTFWFQEGLAPVRRNNKWGFVDTNGVEVIPVQYENAWMFTEGLATVTVNNKHGFIDKTGKMVIPPVYDDAEPFSEGLGFVESNKKMGFVNHNGDTIVPLKYDDCESQFSNGFAAVKRGSMWGFVSREGRERISLRYSWTQNFTDGLAAVEDPIDGINFRKVWRGFP